MRLFDRWAKLRGSFRTGRLIDDAKEMLPRLKGTLSKEDLPSAIVEPGDVEELRATLEFAAEKHQRIAVASGLVPAGIRDLKECLLIFTTRLSQPPVIAVARRAARFSAGFPVESLAIDLTRHDLDWWPLAPLPAGKSVGSLLAGGWEGVRCFRRGGTMAHVNFIEWMGYDGKAYSAGPSISTHGSPDLSGMLFGSRGSLGILTGGELSLHPAMKSRSAALLEFGAADDAAAFFADIAVCSPVPETVLFWGGAATEIIREGNDGTISDNARFTVLIEWDQEGVRLPMPWDGYARYFDREADVRALWQDVLRMPKTAARMYPAREAARIRLPSEALAPLEEAAIEFGHDANLKIAFWGTPEVGYAHLWALLPDVEHVTRIRAKETLNKLVEVAVSLEGKCAPNTARQLKAATSESKLTNSLRNHLREKCDPAGLFEPMVSA